MAKQCPRWLGSVEQVLHEKRGGLECSRTGWDELVTTLMTRELHTMEYLLCVQGGGCMVQVS